MSEDFKTTIAKNLTGSAPVLAVVVGAVFALLGLAGGITYQQWLPMTEVPTRLLSGALGVGLIIFGLNRANATNANRFQPREYGIKIQYPTAGSQVSTNDVGGSIERDLPEGYCLRVFRVFPGSNRFVPLSKARVDTHTKTWVAERCNIGGKTGDQRYYAAYLCGPSAEVLIAFHNEAVTVHRKTMEEYEKLAGKAADFLPSVDGRTVDMHECDRVSVVRL